MKVYKLLHKDGRFYIGSTKDDLNVRFGKHKSNGLIKEFVGCWDDVSIELLEEVQCGTRKELNKKEQEYIDKLKNELCLNKIRASRRDRHDEYKEYYEKIKGTPNDHYAKHREANREKNRQYAKEYNAANKELIKEKLKAYREKNKELIRQRSREAYYRKKASTDSTVERSAHCTSTSDTV